MPANRSTTNSRMTWLPTPTTLLAKLTRSDWLAAGLTASLILAPTAALAASVLVLHGGSGPAVNAFDITFDGRLSAGRK